MKKNIIKTEEYQSIEIIKLLKKWLVNKSWTADPMPSRPRLVRVDRWTTTACKVSALRPVLLLNSLRIRAKETS